MDIEPQLDEDFDGWCVFHLPAFGIHDTSSQNLEHSFALWANNIPSAKSFAITSSHQGVLLAPPHASLKERH